MLDEAGAAALQVAVTAVPEDGRANKAVTALLAKCWRVPRTSVAVVQGATDRRKLLLVRAGDQQASVSYTYAGPVPAELSSAYCNNQAVAGCPFSTCPVCPYDGILVLTVTGDNFGAAAGLSGRPATAAGAVPGRGRPNTKLPPATDQRPLTTGRRQPTGRQQPAAAPRRLAP